MEANRRSPIGPPLRPRRLRTYRADDAGGSVRGVLLWQIADLFRQAARQKLFWAMYEPETYGGYLP